MEELDWKYCNHGGVLVELSKMHLLMCDCTKSLTGKVEERGRQDNSFTPENNFGVRGYNQHVPIGGDCFDLGWNHLTVLSP